MKSLLLIALTHYVVDPMSTVQRLPDVEPVDGEKNGIVRIVAARGEYEPGSFVLKSDEEKTVLPKVGALVNEKGEVFPAANIDLRVVKVWFQNRNAWYSYFGDCGWKLVPELLLHDENLVRVDEKTNSNYARLTEADGRVHERWINPPRQFDKRTGRYSWRTTETFQCMKPNFCDAETLQPVKLEKGRYKQFFLTVNVAKNASAGLYKGAISVDGRVIPLELRVLDYTLPKPRTYADPSKEMLVSFYNNMSDNNIMMRNGYDFKRCRALYAPIYRNFVAHGVDNYGIGDSLFVSFADDEQFALKEMKKAGMRTDVINGGMRGLGVRNPKYAEVVRTGVKTGSVDVARVKRDAAAATRYFGHRNVHFYYGDEPPANYVMCWRAGLTEYQRWGFRTFVAGSRGVFSKAGHIYDWFNMSTDPTSGEYPELWNGAGAARIAWYANQHVGAEDPEMARRQNGLACWLSGYTVLCNYALHFGDWNDDSETYRPMVYAYGSGSGLIDTLAWEGFREGIDDVRYATVLHALALEAVDSPDPALIRLGRRTLKWFVGFDRSRDCLAWARAEMIAQIDGLRTALGHDARLKPVRRDVRNEPEADISQELAADLASCKNTMEVVKTYEKYYFFDKAYETLIASNELLQAASYAANENIRRFDLAEKHLKTVLGDEKAKPEDRSRAALGLITYDLETALRHEDTIFGVSNRLAYTVHRYISDLIGNRTYLCDDRPVEAKEAFRMLRKAADAIKRPISFKCWTYGIHTRLMADDRAGAAEVAQAALASAEAAKFKPEEIYHLKLSSAIGCGREILSGLGAELDAKKRMKVFCDVAQYAVQGGDEATMRKLAKVRESMLQRKSKRRYVVKYSEKPILTPADWEGVNAERQLLDRRYGGSTEILYTDVVSARGAVGGDAKKRANVPTMEVVADRYGLHFRFDVVEEKAAEVAAGLLAGDSWEGYIAPGKDLAYSAIFMNTGRGGKVTMFGTSYDNETYSRPTVKGREDWRRLTTIYSDGRITAYLTLKWEMFAKTLPKNGDVWDYENMRWSRTGDYVWNGTESIHGRSTWGELVFDLPASAHAAIVREQLFAARQVYLDEKSDHMDGVLSHWSDPDLGDVEFYTEKVKPIEKTLDAYLSRVKTVMSDEEIETLGREAMPGWLNIRASVDRLRADWLTRLSSAPCESAFAAPQPPQVKNLEKDMKSACPKIRKLGASAGVCVKDGETVAFMGDSITQQGNRPAGYVNLVMKGLEVAGVKGAKKIAAGISGQRSTHMNARLDKDILQKRPEWMTFSCGVNDVWHGRGGVPLEQYKKLVTDIFDRAAASNVNVIVLTPTVIGENLENAENAKLAGYVAWLKEEAARRKLRLADLNADMQAEIRRIRAAEPGRKGFLVTSDGVHMAFPGDCVMAWGVLRAMGVEESMKEKVFAAFRRVPQAYSIGVSFTADEWADYQRRCRKAHRADYIYARDLLIGPPKAR